MAHQDSLRYLVARQVVVGRYRDPAICLLPVYEAELQLKRSLLPV